MAAGELLPTVGAEVFAAPDLPVGRGAQNRQGAVRGVLDEPGEEPFRAPVDDEPEEQWAVPRQAGAGATGVRGDGDRLDAARGEAMVQLVGEQEVGQLG